MIHDDEEAKTEIDELDLPLVAWMACMTEAQLRRVIKGGHQRTRPGVEKVLSALGFASLDELSIVEHSDSRAYNGPTLPIPGMLAAGGFDLWEAVSEAATIVVDRALNVQSVMDVKDDYRGNFYSAEHIKHVMVHVLVTKFEQAWRRSEAARKGDQETIEVDASASSPLSEATAVLVSKQSKALAEYQSTVSRVMAKARGDAERKGAADYLRKVFGNG